MSDFNEQLSTLNNQIDQARRGATEQTSAASLDAWWSTSNAMTISAAVLFFGLIVCLLAAFLLRQGKSSDAILKTLGTILIIVAALFLVVAGYSDKQIAPVIGLLGTIVGYLLGKNTNEKA